MPLLSQKKAQHFLNSNKQYVAIGTAFIASLAMGVLTLGIGIHSLQEYNQDCTTSDINSLEADCNSASIDYDMSSELEHACYCYNLEQQSFLAIAGGFAATTASIGFPLSMWIYNKCKKSGNNTPTAQTLVELHNQNGESNV